MWDPVPSFPTLNRIALYIHVYSLYRESLFVWGVKYFLPRLYPWIPRLYIWSQEIPLSFPWAGQKYIYLVSVNVKMTANNRQRAHPGAPSLIEHKTLKFVIVNKPSQSTLPQFVKVIQCYSMQQVCWKCMFTDDQYLFTVTWWMFIVTTFTCFWWHIVEVTVNNIEILS